MDVGTTARVLTVTTDAALVIGLTFLREDWVVESQPDLSGGVDADVVVVDLGTTAAALEAITSFEAELPPVAVVGDRDPEEAPEGLRVLLRPYTLDELADVVGSMLASSAEDSDGAPAAGGAVEPDLRTPRPADAGAEPGPDEEPATERLTAWVKRLRRRDQAGAPDEPDAEEARAEEPAPTVTQAPAEGTRLVEEAPAAAVGPAPVDAGTGAPRRSRWIGRRPRTDDAERDLRRRLARALTASAELERLVADLPLLRSFPALALAVAKMIEEQVHADSVAVWRPQDDGWHAVACRGLSPIEANIVVAREHPLFAQVDASGGAVLIDPAESVQGVVAGIGGAHTESFMAASIAVGPGRYGIVTVGRNVPLDDRDLDRFVALVVEAALGLSLADWFERVAGLADTDGSGGRAAPAAGNGAGEPDADDGPAQVVAIRKDLSIRS